MTAMWVAVVSWRAAATPVSSARTSDQLPSRLSTRSTRRTRSEATSAKRAMTSVGTFRSTCTKTSGSGSAVSNRRS